MICRSLFLVLMAVLFLASKTHAEDATVYVAPGGSMQFVPAGVSIDVGDKVTWVWNGPYQPYHSVTSGTPGHANNLFNSGSLGGSANFTHTFTTAGSFPYFCQVHPTMMAGYVVVGDGSPSPTPSPTSTPTGPPSTLGNISTRLRVLAGDNGLIGGLIATGTAGKKVIIRAIGPSLSGFGVPGALANPTLDLFQGSTLLLSSDDWNSSTQQAEIASCGLAPSNAAESAIIWTLTPGENYTAVVRGANGTTGIGVVDAFDLDSAAPSKLGNISTRGFVDVDDNVMIAGLIAGPSNGTSLKILVRALGPTLSDFGVAGALANPTLDLVNSNGTVIRSNNNWKDDSQQRAQIEAASLAPAHDEEAALVETVAPGAYTAVVRGSGRTTGVGLVEAYHIP
jgi:plastocyanin